MHAGVEVLDAAKEKDGILSLQLLESKVDHSVLSVCHIYEVLKIYTVYIFSHNACADDVYVAYKLFNTLHVS